MPECEKNTVYAGSLFQHHGLQIAICPSCIYAVKSVSATQSRKVAESKSLMTLHMMHMHYRAGNLAKAEVKDNAENSDGFDLFYFLWLLNFLGSNQKIGCRVPKILNKFSQPFLNCNPSSAPSLTLRESI